jgi:Ca2+-binding RTX toxin-like protein
VGSYVPTIGASAPIPAPVGSYVPTIGASAPIPAPVGYYVPTTGASAATEAMPGYFVASSGSSSETPAPPGYYVPTAGATQATAATPGYYVPTAGAIQEIPDPPGSFSGPAATAYLTTGVYAVGSALVVVGANTADTVKISPAGTTLDGTAGVTIKASVNNVSIIKTFTQHFTAIAIAGFGGNDTIQLAASLTLPTTVVEGDGNDTIQLGDGDNVVVEGNGKDSVTAGNGANLIVAGLGPHTIRVGNGTNILIDGSATVVAAAAGDSFEQILEDWKANASTQVDRRLSITYNTKYANTLKAGTGRDWFFYVPPTTSNKKPTDMLN